VTPKAKLSDIITVPPAITPLTPKSNVLTPINDGAENNVQSKVNNKPQERSIEAPGSSSFSFNGTVASAKDDTNVNVSQMAEILAELLKKIDQKGEKIEERENLETINIKKPKNRSGVAKKNVRQFLITFKICMQHLYFDFRT
jgi:hypothetical protein